MPDTKRLSLLIVDDQEDVLELYGEILGDELGHHVELASLPGKAARLMSERLFDVVIIDAKMTYKGAPLGGLLLADETASKLGVDSVILISQYEVSESVKHINPAFEFLRKPQSGGLEDWIKKQLLVKAKRLAERQFGFVAMPFGNKQANEWYREHVTPWMNEAGFEVRRMDEIATTKAINQEILKRIDMAHFVIFFTVDQSANAFYEAGYAYARGKFLIILTPDEASLPFNIKPNYAITFDRPPEEMKRDILTLMQGLRGMGG